MRRGLAAFISVLALGAAIAPTASATHFPEQPGDNVAQGCAAVIAHNTSLAHSAPVAGAILNDLLVDACLGGP